MIISYHILLYAHLQTMVRNCSDVLRNVATVFSKNLCIMHVVCDLKVHVRVFNCESLQGSNIRPRESFFLSSREYFFSRFSRKFPEIWILWITISTRYRCIVQCSCSSLHGYDHDIVPWIVLTRFGTAQMQQPSFQKRGFARAKDQGPWCLLFVWSTLCWWLESAGFSSRKFAKEWVKVKMHFKGAQWALPKLV